LSKPKSGHNVKDLGGNWGSSIRRATHGMTACWNWGRTIDDWWSWWWAVLQCSGRWCGGSRGAAEIHVCSRWCWAVRTGSDRENGSPHQNFGRASGHTRPEERFHPWFSPRIRVVSRVLDQELLCIPKERVQDWILNIRWERSDVSHAVFYQDSVCSYGLVVTSLYNHDEICAPCNEPCQWRCRSCWNIWQHVQLFLWKLNTHNFRICM